MKNRFIQNLRAWIALSRPPFHAVGILPFFLGTFLAYRLEGAFHPEVLALGVSGVMLIMLSAYHSGEYFDQKENAISSRLHSNPFAGGSRMIPEGKIPARVAFWTSMAAILLALLIGIVLQFVCRTGPYTLFLGLLGALPGFFYSTEPVRLVKRGLGEVLIGFCYGWLPVASAYYIQTASIAPVIHWLWLPIGFSIFNVIFLNEFPDYEADAAAGKKNLLVRIGKSKGKVVYILCNLLTCLTMLWLPCFGVPFQVVYFCLPAVAIALLIVVEMLKNRHEDPRCLQILCGLNVAVNIGMSLALILAYG
ncbi:MAG: prenyltransferase [Smithella sp.]|jgi:1,4-dihydroxy-2-naphthoate octaprenyltransferase|nr:prenyltransferase [Syntrophaceae bacterium]MBP8667106.1 prenyltransferase [Syntrophaceae bacterium]MBP9650991.1 prenyltransferase [Syntrophaceae bacterium]NMC92162.1 prenyltransferase [Smithella sp.]HQP05585.1 prenyltransferase [Smithellaceae bacterium]